jgi:3-deoxy-manno-octulosonate cytidylyltransferase (CMP-KDO synthetase)
MSCAVVVIPARLEAQRLPGKPLLDDTGKPLVVHVADQARQAELVDRVVVATDSDQVLRTVQLHTHEAVMTRADHPNGTSRVAEVAEGLDDSVDIVVNVQGDEPLIDPAVIDQLIQRMRTGDEPMGTIGSPFADGEDPADPNIVKVVCDAHGRAMYFSRSLIPHDRDTQGVAVPMKHVGLYAYRREFLPIYLGLEPTPAEQAEKLEQLRVLEHGHAIAVHKAVVDHHGIDTPEQYHAFVEFYEQRQQGDVSGR